jgi:hypothetical protein
MNCTIENCPTIAIARGLCSKHYKRWQINGHTGITNGKGCPSPHERFALQTKRMENGCLEWCGHVAKNGYGHTKWNRQFYLAHRFAWELKKGPIPPDVLVLHNCDNKRCVDTEHLYLGDGAQNSADALERGQIKTGERSAISKLTNAQVREAKNSSESVKTMAKRFGVHWATLYKAMKDERRA